MTSQFCNKERMFVLNNGSFFPKNTSARVGACILLFIPLVLAVFFASKINPNEVSKGAVKSLTVSYDGITSTFSDEDSFNIYSSLTDGAVQIDDEFRDLEAEIPYEITFTESDGCIVSYKLYMLKDASDCIFTTSDKKYFMMDSSIAEQLLKRDEFSGVNIASLLPVATYSRGTSTFNIVPDNYTWTYRNLEGITENISANKKAENP